MPKGNEKILMDFNFFMPVKVISGKDCVKKNSDVFSHFGKKCLIITGKSSARISGALDDVISCLNEQNTEYGIYDKISQNPLLSSCAEAGELCKETGADFIIAIGGGSVLDAAKAAAIFASNSFDNISDIYKKNYSNAPLPLIVAGTTAGTGSEVSPTAVITLDQNGLKKSITGEECFAKIALCDPKYTYNIPRDITVSTALDAFAHATEGFFSRKHNTATDTFAKLALPGEWKALKTLAKNKSLSEEERNELYYCSVYSGMVLAIGTVYPHGLGYALTEQFGVAHGQACAAFDMHLIEWSEKYAPERAAEFFDLLGASSDEVLSVINSLIDIDKNVKFSKAQIDEIISRFGDDNPKFKNVYGNFTTKEAFKLFSGLFGE